MKIIEAWTCPLWNKIPDEGLRSSELIEFFEEKFSDIALDKPIITATMIQNYRRWGLIAKSQGRLYYREEIARLIVITLYKQILSIEEVKEGIELSLKQMPIEEAYNSFADGMTSSIQAIYEAIKNNKNLKIYPAEIIDKKLGVVIISYAYSLKLLATLIIQAGGIKNLRSQA